MEGGYTDSFYHVPKPRGEHHVSAVDVAIDGNLFRLFYPSSNSVHACDWPKWSFGQEQSHNLSKFSIHPSIRCLMEPLIQYLTKDIRVPCGWSLQPKELITSVTWPVAVISHGYGATRTSFSTIACDLASHGCVVAVIGHRDGSGLCTTNEDENVYPTSTPFKQYHKDNKQLEIRVSEILATVHTLDEINKGSITNLLQDSVKSHEVDEPINESVIKILKNKLDLSQCVLIGHSFGAAAAIAAVDDHPQIFRSAILLDPWMYPVKDRQIQTNVPLLIITTENFDIGTNHKSLVTMVECARRYGAIIDYYLIRGSHHIHGNDFPWAMGSIMLFLTTRTTLPQSRIITELHHNLILRHLCKYIDLAIQIDDYKVNSQKIYVLPKENNEHFQ